MIRRSRPRLVEVGHAINMQYKSDAKRHAVERDGEGGWRLVCTWTPATREYSGWVTAIECSDCRKSVGR